MSTDRKKLILIDAHALIHRAYHAIPDFTSSLGEPTGALYGVSTMLMRAVKELKPTYVVACFDLPKPTFRHVAYDAYKGKRKETEEPLVAQLKRAPEVFEAFGIPCLSAEGFEADDVLGTLTERFKKETDLEIVILSGDMDTLQLVKGDKVKVFTLKKGLNDTVTYNERKVKERYGFGPEHIPDYKGLAGDSSDNIIGVKGIGEKTATMLVESFGSIENIYKALKKDKEKLLEIGIKERSIKLLEEQEEEALFSKELATIRKDAPVTYAIPEKSWIESFDPKKLEDLFETLEFKSLKTRVKELTSFDAPKDELVKKTKKEAKEEEEQSVDQDTLERAQIALWVLDSDKTNPDLSSIYTAAKTADLSQALQKLEEQIEKEGLSYVYKSIELPLIPIVKKMEQSGIKIDKGYLKELSVRYGATLSDLEKEIYTHAGGEFNVSSPKQLGEILFDRLSLTAKGLRKTSSGARSTNIDALEKLKGTHPIIELIMKHRELQKLVSTYIDPLQELTDEESRVHTHFIQTGAATGRFSSQNPNMQNIPVKGEHGKIIRKAFIAEEGFTFVSFDYSQIELRIAAILSRDEKMLTIFREGKDAHASVAASMFGVSEKEVTNDQRRVAKVLNFGILYGMGVNAIKETLGSDRASAQQFFDTYRASFPRLHEYLEEVKEFARKQGYTETLFGRRRKLLMMRSSLPFIRAQGERMAINAPIQGTGADILKLAMIDVDAILKTSYTDKEARLLLQVHDELIFEVKEEKVQEFIQSVTKLLESLLIRHKKEAALIPLTVSSASAKNWGDLK